MQTFFPGTRVLVPANKLFRGDAATAVLSGVVTCWYGKRDTWPWEHLTYESMIDVEFDLSPGKISYGIFTDDVREAG